MENPFRIQHYIIIEQAGSVLIRQEQRAAGKRGAIFASAMLAPIYFIGPYRPFSIDGFTPAIFLVCAGGFALSIAIALYFSIYEKSWLIGPTAITVRSTTSPKSVAYPIDNGTVAEINYTYYLPGTDEIKIFPYTLTFKFSSGHVEALKFTNKTGGEKVLALIRKVLPKLRITGDAQKF